MRWTMSMGFVIASCLMVAAQPIEMVTNGSFEAVEDGLPTGWRINVDAGAVQTADAPDGERWLKLVKPEGASHTLVTQRVEVKPDTGYRLRAYLRAPKASFYKLVAYDSVLNGLAVKSTGWAVIGDWLELALDFRTRETDTVVNVGLLAFGAEAHWDSVRMWEDDSVRIGDLTDPINELDDPSKISHFQQHCGYLLFGRKANDFVSARYVPNHWDRATPMQGACPRGEFETIVVGIHATRDLENVSAELYDPRQHTSRPGNPPIDAELFQVGHGHRELNSQAYLRHPLLLLPPHEVDVPAGETLQYAVRVHVPSDYPERATSVRLNLSVKDFKRRGITIHVDVPQVTLDPAQSTYFMYYSDSYLPEEMASGPLQAAYYRDMAEHGMNSVSLYVVPERETETGFEIDLHHDVRYPPGDVRAPLGIAERIAQMKAAGLVGGGRPLVLISGGSGLYGWGAFRDPNSVRSLMQLGATLGWPELLFYMHDEPNDEARVAGVRDTHARVYEDIPEARTVTAIGEYGIEQIGDLYDVWIAAISAVDEDLIERARREGKQLWAYDCRHQGQRPAFDRFVCGLWAWRTGIKGLGQWAYYSKEMLAPDEDGLWHVPEDWKEWYMIASEAGPIGTVGWEARREGIEDYRTLITLERLVAEHSDFADAHTAADISTYGTAANRLAHLTKRGRELLAEARRITPVDAFAEVPRDWRYVWEYDFAPEAGLRAMSDLRLEMQSIIKYLQAD